MPNCPDFVFAFFGAQLLGAVVVPINTRFRARELGYVIENADLVALVTSDIVDEHVDFVERLSRGLPGLAGAADPAALELRGGAAPALGRPARRREPAGLLARRAFDELARRGRASSTSWRGAPASASATSALMLFTSGTTAASEGLPAHARGGASASGVGRRRGCGSPPDDRVWDALPMFHMSCLGPLIFTFELGATLISMTHFEPAAALAA